MSIKFFLWCYIFIAVIKGVNAQELPRASFQNCFYIMPLYEHMRTHSLSYAEKEAQILKMKEQLGHGNLYHRLGFSFIFPLDREKEVQENCELAIKHGIHLGLIFGNHSHTRDDYREIASQDLKLFQWRLDGSDWKGAFDNSGTLEIAEDQRDYKIPTPSRYAKPLRDYNLTRAYDWAIKVRELMNQYPGVITCINGPIEEELAIGGHSNNNKLADYSPYAITEFRDWLRHTGMYDVNGKYAGEGANKHIIGDLLFIEGKPRSQFYDDPDPDNNNGTGVSFNQFFGTDFKTWSLKYWDLDLFPDVITNEDFNCTPHMGRGYVKNGFDAPRNLDFSSEFWQAWSWDIPDQKGAYPKGNPVSPAFGFRQHMVRNHVRDLMDTIAAAGIPRELMYAHQIPGEALGKFTGAGGRNRSSASTVWTGYMEKSGNVGITRFGDIDPLLMTQYAKDWGIFEWHTQPTANAASAALYGVSLKALNKYYEHHCHLLFPGWWSKNIPDSTAVFPLNDSKFAEAIAHFYKSKSEIPFHQQGNACLYTPPKVSDVKFIDEKKQNITVSWNEKIWPELLPTWLEWKDFSHFEINWSFDGQNWSTDKTDKCSYSLKANKKQYQIKVRAVSKSGKPGVWIIEEFAF